MESALGEDRSRNAAKNAGIARGVTIAVGGGMRVVTTLTRALSWGFPVMLAATAACDGDESTGAGGGAATSSGGAADGGHGGSDAPADGGSAGEGGGATSAGGGGEGTGGAPGEICPATAFFCDDFEEATVGEAPSGAWDPGSQGVVTTDHAHSGSNAVRLEEGFNFESLPLADAPDVLFARVMMWSEFQGETADSRFSIMSTSTESGHEVNIDSNGELLVIHHYPNGEAGITSTLAVPTNQWVCIETSFDRESRIFKSWVDGVEATELSVPASDETIPDPWTLFQLSGVVYHGGTTTQLYDDVALSTERVGCP